ncbi:MAG: adenylyltransferase/cytidyltransferase family protein [Candidatus Bipolaricaulota bacterium]|nr:adenylyltransferase/cytidyltransferase family protein [Candidatus Bipolaricaulota bacterium]
MARVVAVGRFDGVHLGHQHLLREARRFGDGGPVIAYTFPPRGPSLLTLAAKVRLLQDLADEVVVAPWEEIEGLEPEEFVRRELVGRVGAEAVAVGPDHRFGKGRTGDLRTLERLARELGVAVHPIPALRRGGAPVSAARIRDLIGAGEVEAAGRLLGRPSWLAGQPVRGAGLARSLGYPTVNLELFPELVRPRAGVYAAWAHWPGGEGKALFYLGDRPTFPGLPPSVEVHLLTPPEGAVAGPVEVHLLAFLRPDRRFPSPAALAAQIGEDRARAEEVLAGQTPPGRLLGAGLPSQGRTP